MIKYRCAVGVLCAFFCGRVFGSTIEYCTDSDAPTYDKIREQSYYKTTDGQFQLTAEGRDILQTVQQTQQPYDIYPESLDDEAICAAYLYELSQRLRGPTAPSRFGMYHPEDRTVCSAWELPYCYWYRGGEVMSDLGDSYGPQLKRNPRKFTSLVSQTDLLQWFASAWNYTAYLGDMTFLYSESAYLHMIGVYGNYNSHIGKHIGVQEFEVELTDLGENTSNQLMMRQALGCGYEMRELIEPIWKHYPMQLNNTPIRVLDNDEILIYDDSEWTLVDLKPGDVLRYSDVMVTHFWEGEKLQSLMQMICEENFYPIAVVSVGEQWIGKE